MKKNFTQIGNELSYDTTISDATFRTLVVLLSFDYEAKGYSFPSQDLISKKRGKCRKMIIEHIKTLVCLGLIVVNKVNGHNVYSFTCTEDVSLVGDAPEQCEENIMSDVTKTSHSMRGKLHTNNINVNNTKKNINTAQDKKELTPSGLDIVRERNPFLRRKK